MDETRVPVIRYRLCSLTDPGRTKWNKRPWKQTTGRWALEEWEVEPADNEQKWSPLRLLRVQYSIDGKIGPWHDLKWIAARQQGSTCSNVVDAAEATEAAIDQELAVIR